MIIRARIVVTMAGAPINDGAVAVSGNKIVDVGAFKNVKARNSGETLDLGEQVLLPGLINAHCHLDYTCLRGKIPPQKSFTDWIRAINTQKSKLSPADYSASIKDGFDEAKKFGTTAIANLTAFPELISEVQPPIRTWWFSELIDVRAPERANELVDSAIESLDRAGALRGLAPHTLFTASKNLFRRCEEIAQREHILLTTHLAESPEEMEMFRNGSGPLYEFIKSIGRPMDDCGEETPLKIFLGAPGRARSANAPASHTRSVSGRAALPAGGRTLPQWIVVHLNELTENDFDLLERSNSKFHIVHCPRSHSYFGHSPFAFERLSSLGFTISLGTDSLASNESLSLFDEMRAFQKNFPQISAEEILKTVTVNPARALRCEKTLGQIRPGFEADFIAVPCSGSKNIFEQILTFDAPVHPILRNKGRIS